MGVGDAEIVRTGRRRRFKNNNNTKYAHIRRTIFGRGHRRRDEAHTLFARARRGEHHVYAVYYYYYYYYDDPSPTPPPPPSRTTRTRAPPCAHRETTAPDALFLEAEAKNKRTRPSSSLTFRASCPRPRPPPPPPKSISRATPPRWAPTIIIIHAKRAICAVGYDFPIPVRRRHRDTCGRHLHTTRTLTRRRRRRRSSLVCFFDFRVNITSDLRLGGGGWLSRWRQRLTLNRWPNRIPCIRVPHIIHLIRWRVRRFV